MRVLLGTIILCCCAAALLVFSIPRIQYDFAFSPSPLHASALSAVRGAEPLWCETKDGETLSGLRVAARGPPRDGCGRVSIFFHGNAGHVLRYLDMAQIDAAAGFDCYLFDYRGFGASTGHLRLTEERLFSDAEAMVRAAQRHSGAPRAAILLHGFSLGCAAALHVAAQRDKWGAVLLESPFARFLNAARHIVPALRHVDPLLDDTFRNEESAGRLSSETRLLLVHGRADRITPFTDSQRLLRVARCRRKRMYTSYKEDHGGPHADPRLFAQLASWGF